MTPPDLDRKTALFLDLDGTLLEIAATPELVVVPPALPGLLAHLHASARRCGRHRQRPAAAPDRQPAGAVSCPRPPASMACHCAIGDGTLEEMPVGIAVPEDWREALSRGGRALARRADRDPSRTASPCTIAWRPSARPRSGSWCAAWCRADHPWFRLIPAREAVEIGLRAASKGDAVERLMAHAPFHGRRPIFIGDDFTDEAGMSMARRVRRHGPARRRGVRRRSGAMCAPG